MSNWKFWFWSEITNNIFWLCQRNIWDNKKLIYFGVRRAALWCKFYQQFYPKDLECVSSLVTFENLQYVCQNPAVFEVLPWLPEGRYNQSTESTDINIFPSEILKRILIKNEFSLKLKFSIILRMPLWCNY